MITLKSNDNKFFFQQLTARKHMNRNQSMVSSKAAIEQAYGPKINVDRLKNMYSRMAQKESQHTCKNKAFFSHHQKCNWLSIGMEGR